MIISLNSLKKLLKIENIEKLALVVIYFKNLIFKFAKNYFKKIIAIFLLINFVLLIIKLSI